ncbi:MAG: thymidine kinase [Barrevirus sp.]|uniref:Thymidine kinase n=1 Tax=Barrevirus sp. TaxID=2487763 RepID=A0A3G4ZPS0_9VIRU|nr:MAG: thymidine kinase [Barrevirus sp.]
MSLNLILGNMFSGKTSELIRRYNRYSIGNKKCLMIKYKNDTRYDPFMIVTHDNIKIKAIVCEFLYEADIIISNYDVICIDEVQFYKDANIFCDKWANQGKTVEACGLNGTFNRTQFPIISNLIPLAENITFLKAICKESGEEATFTQLNTDTDGLNKETNELIGGSDKYGAVDRKTYLAKMGEPDYLNQFLNFYAELNGLKNVSLIGYVKEQLGELNRENLKMIGDSALAYYNSLNDHESASESKSENE